MIKRHSGSNSSVFWGYLRSLSDMKKVRRGNHNSIFRQIIFNSEQNYFTTELISWNFVTKIVAVISTSQCGNFIIFLSLRFYVKSIFENQEVLKMPFSQFLGLWKCKNINSEALNVFKREFLDFQNPLHWFHVKSEGQKSLQFPPAQCGKMRNSLSRKKYFVTHLVKSLLSQKFCLKCVRENSRNFHTTLWPVEESNVFTKKAQYGKML